MKKIKCDLTFAAELSELIVDLSFLGVEGEIDEEDLIHRARDLMRSSEFKAFSRDWRRDVWDNEKENEE